MSNSYAIITPAYNEGPSLPRVIAGIASQDPPPIKWIILDDRSTDDTWEILTAAATRHSFLEPVRVTGPAGRQVGANVVHLFTQEARDYYRLETLWQDAGRIDWAEAG